MKLFSLSILLISSALFGLAGCGGPTEGNINEKEPPGKATPAGAEETTQRYGTGEAPTP